MRMMADRQFVYWGLRLPVLWRQIVVGDGQRPWQLAPAKRLQGCPLS
jgi:hypothetical protein